MASGVQAEAGEEAKFPPKKARQAVRALLQHVAKVQAQRTAEQLLDDEEQIHLVVGMKRIPQKKETRTNPYEIELPYPLYNREGVDACLIVKDQQGESAETARRLIQKEGIEGISLVLGVDELRKEYRVYERRRKLAASYDIFFADARVIKTLPKLLGNSFFKKKKHPVPVELGKKSWKKQLEFAKRCTHLYISSGTCSYIRAGTSGMGETALTKNIRAIARRLRTSLPGGWDNVQSLHIKTDDSVALPIYQALPDELKRNQQAAQRK